MTRFIDVADIQKIVREIGAEKFMVCLADYILADYLRWHDFEKSIRVVNHVPDGVIELMPTSDALLYGVKYVNGHPKNTLTNQLTVVAFGVLAEIKTGYPLLLSELTIATALRTAATSALMASVLARPNSKVMAIIGNGAQSEFQALAFKAIVGITECRVFDIDSAATDKLCKNLAGVKGLTIIKAKSVQDAVDGADIVTTITADKNYATILTPDMIKAGMHINAVGGDCPGKTELHADILKAARVFVEYEPQTRIEGEIQQLPAHFPVIEMWQVLNQQIVGRENAAQITVFDSVGFAIEDFSVLRYLYDLIQKNNGGKHIDLIPEPSDPKNLFQYAI